MLKTRPWRGWLPSINMRGGAPFQGVKEKIDEATLSRCSLSPLVEVLGLEEFRFESEFKVLESSWRVRYVYYFLFM